VNEQVWWYLARASGIVAWAMLTASVIWGIVLATKAFPEHRRPLWLLAMHRWLAGLTVAFVAIHIAALVADSYITFDLADVTVPYASDWQPGAVALGILAMWLLVAVELTSLAKRRLSRKVWRWVHLTSYVTFWLTSLHAAFAGTDTSSRIYQVGAAASILAVVWALAYRITVRRSARRAARAGQRSPAGRTSSTRPQASAAEASSTEPVNASHAVR
jgi:sulfoxide reductase heme-binding subunit YedZ